MNRQNQTTLLIMFSILMRELVSGQNSVTINGKIFYKVSTILEFKLVAKKYDLEDRVSETVNCTLQYEIKENTENSFKLEYGII